MITTDFHIHSEFSSDSTAKISEIVIAAIHQGITAICITDHYDLDQPGTLKQHPLEMPRYLESLKNAQKNTPKTFMCTSALKWA
jgi:histidinol-phosphatase (PHP family)